MKTSLSATTGQVLVSREVSQLSDVHWFCQSNLLLISSADGALTVTSRTLGKFQDFIQLIATVLYHLDVVIVVDDLTV